MIPGAVLAQPNAGVDQERPLRPAEPSAVTQTIDGKTAQLVQLSIFDLINGGRQTITFPGGQKAEFKLSNFEQQKLTPEQRAVYDLLEALAAQQTDEAWGALKKILTTAGADRALAGKTATVDQKTAQKAAAYFEAIGLTAEERTDGLTVAAALAHGQVIVALGASPSRGEEKLAEQLSGYTLAQLNELRALVHAPAIADEHLAKRAKDLRARVIDRPLVEHAIAAAHARGFSVETPNLLKHLKEVGPRPAGEQARADWYRRIVEGQGYEWRTGVNQMNVVGLRAYDVETGKNGNAFNQWNDTLAFVWNDGHRWQVKELAATTDPGYKSHWESPDIDGNGVGDVAHLLPGQYPYQTGTHRGTYGAGVPEYNVPVVRDTNHNGQIDGGEQKRSKERGDVGYGINIHWGPGYESGGVGGYSLGCQVTVLNNNEFHAQVTPLLEANRGQLLYTLVDMERMA